MDDECRGLQDDDDPSPALQIRDLDANLYHAGPAWNIWDKQFTENPRVPMVHHEAERGVTRGSLNGKHLYHDSLTQLSVLGHVAWLPLLPPI